MTREEETQRIENVFGKPDSKNRMILAPGICICICIIILIIHIILLITE